MELRKLALTALTTGALAVGIGAEVNQPASASTTYRYNCGDGGSAVYYHCGQMAGYYFHYNPPGCTAPDGCWAGYYFYYWQ